MSLACTQCPGSSSRYFMVADGGLGLKAGRPGRVVSACVQPCLPEQEAVVGSFPEHGERVRLALTVTRALRLHPGRETQRCHISREILSVAGALEIRSQCQPCK